MCLDQCIEGDDVDKAIFHHLGHPGLGILQLVALYAGIQHCVVDDAVELAATALQRMEDALGTLKVSSKSAVANHSDVLGDICWTRLQELLCKVVAATAKSGTNETALGAGIQEGAFTLAVPGTGGVLQVHLTGSIWLIGLGIVADESREQWRLLWPGDAAEAVGQCFASGPAADTTGEHSDGKFGARLLATCRKILNQRGHT
mmetsp:Transcript_22209/g.39484  ORF Transcript_22209/g.39484 Transcript_22209/m.39484 type:complete len:203 (-) Transcript_22209:1234-1842(-)